MTTLKFFREATVEQKFVAHIPDDVLKDITGFSLEELTGTKYAVDRIIRLLGEQYYSVEFGVINESILNPGYAWGHDIIK